MHRVFEHLLHEESLSAPVRATGWQASCAACDLSTSINCIMLSIIVCANNAKDRSFLSERFTDLPNPNLLLFAQYSVESSICTPTPVLEYY